MWLTVNEHYYDCSRLKFIDNFSNDPVLARQYVVELAAASAISAEQLEAALLRLEGYMKTNSQEAEQD